MSKMNLAAYYCCEAPQAKEHTEDMEEYQTVVLRELENMIGMYILIGNSLESSWIIDLFFPCVFPL